ncbi:hypothetical protein G6011_09876 [Alternaria panax]|uniref:Uncharacterized protein n=1 Tax=Alternaria panax TaxID=48097 RepID=A0AAD4FDD8_9PLEO|nr:hypothetical protein G6011_09876 [Alternaria panax]
MTLAQQNSGLAIHGDNLILLEVNDNWSNGTWHSQQPEPIDYQLYANKFCLPNEVGSWTEKQGCKIGALPQYIVNTTEEADVAVAMKWATNRNIRIIVKGTGQDLNGRSSGASSLSIWTHNFRNLTRNTAWRAANVSSPAEDVFIVGFWPKIGQRPQIRDRSRPECRSRRLHPRRMPQSGISSGPANDFCDANRTRPCRQRGPEPRLLLGAGAGQYSVVTEYMIKHHPAPRNVIMASVQTKSSGRMNASMEASWSAIATWLSALPDLIDAGLASAATVAAGSTAPKFLPEISVSNGPFTGIALNRVFWASNTTPDAVEALVQPILSKLLATNTNNTSTNTSLISTSMTT